MHRVINELHINNIMWQYLNFEMKRNETIFTNQYRNMCVDLKALKNFKTYVTPQERVYSQFYKSELFHKLQIYLVLLFSLEVDLNSALY